MLPNSITVAGVYCNTSSAATAAEKTFTRIEETINRSTYVNRAEHSDSFRDQVQFYRTYPKRSGASLGSTKSAVKFTNDVEVPNAEGTGNITLPMICEVSFSIPVGVAQNDRSRFRAVAVGLLWDYLATISGLTFAKKSDAPNETPVALLTNGTPEI